MTNKKMTVDQFDKLQKIENSKNIAIDFDGVLHKCSKGYHDGTVYDEPILGSTKSLSDIKKMGFNIVIYSCKTRSDRPQVNGISGTQMIWDWLKKHGMSEFVSEVVTEKPRAFVYIDDKGYRFKNWDQTLDFIKNVTS